MSGPSVSLPSHAPAPPTTAIVVSGLIASCAPLLLLIANTDWFFTREGYLDPWNYVGLFQQYLDPDYLPEDYKLARLPWILSGFLVTKLLPPVTAAVTLHGLFLCATALALFVGMHALFHRPALAGVVALSFGFYTLAHGSGSWDYHNTGAGAFYLATFALLALPATLDGNRALLTIAGATAALAVHTNITLINFLPALAFTHVQATSHRAARRPSRRDVVVRAAWAASGAVLITTLLGLVNWSIGREFLFFGPLIRIVVRYISDPRHQEAFYRPWSSGWLLGAWHLSFLAAVLLAGITSLATTRLAAADSSRRLANALVMQFVVMAFVWIGWQSAGQTALNVDYFAYVLIPSCFTALGGILYRGWPDWCERHWLITLLSTTLLFVVFLAVAEIPGVYAVGGFIAPSVFIGGCALFLCALATHLWRPSLISVLLFVTIFAFGNRVLSVPVDYQASDPCKVQPAVYGAIVDGAKWLMTVDPLYTRLYTWFDDEELLHPSEGCAVRLGHVGYSMTTMASMSYVTKPMPMPEVQAVPDEAVLGLSEGGRILAIISSQPARAEEWKHRIAGLGLVHKEIDRHVVPVLGSEFTMYAWTLQRPSP